MLPKLDGFEVCQSIREFSTVPIVMLTAKGDDMDKILGLEYGADDYVTKPFSGKELIMRVGAVLARTNKSAGGENEQREVYENGSLKVDFTAHDVTIDGKRVEMTPKEYDLLFYFIRNKGIALTRENLISNVWDYDFYGDDRTLDTHIKLLRKSLGDYRDLIVTLRGVGYRFEG